MANTRTFALLASCLSLCLSVNANPVSSLEERAHFPKYEVKSFNLLAGAGRIANPSIVRTHNKFYAYGTHLGQGPDAINVPVATSNTEDADWTNDGTDALPGKVGDWACEPGEDDGPQVWSPDVSVLNNGSYIMYFSAHPKDPANPGHCQGHRCIGVAYSNDPKGPFQPFGGIWDCTGGGAIAPNSVKDNGKRYVVYKNGSHRKGGEQTTLQQVDPNNGFDKIGDLKVLIQQNPHDANGFEGQALRKTPEGNWILLHTTGDPKTAYQIHYSINNKLDHNLPYKNKGVLLRDGDLGGASPDHVFIPGGSDFIDGDPNSLNFFFFGKNSTDAKGNPNGALFMYHGVLGIKTD